MLGKPRIRLNNLKTSLRFPCLGLNPIIDSINLVIRVPSYLNKFYKIHLKYEMIFPFQNNANIELRHNEWIYNFWIFSSHKQRCTILGVGAGDGVDISNFFFKVLRLSFKILHFLIPLIDINYTVPNDRYWSEKSLLISPFKIWDL